MRSPGVLRDTRSASRATTCHVQTHVVTGAWFTHTAADHTRSAPGPSHDHRASTGNPRPPATTAARARRQRTLHGHTNRRRAVADHINLN